MRVLAARFSDRRVASAVRDRLMQRLRGGVEDVDIAPLGVPGHPESSDMVLAGCFSDDSAAVVTALVREAGGEIVANVDESWTRPRLTQAPHWNPGFARGDRLHA